MEKTIKFGKEARASMMIGLDTAVNLAKVTLGGKGKIVKINYPGMIHSTMDGVTVLKNVAMIDDTEDMGVKAVLEAAEKQVGECGDGTTSVAILLQAILKGGIEAIGNGADPLKIREGIDKAVDIVIEEINKIAVPIKRDSKELYQVAKVSAHGDEEIASLISQAFKEVGEHGSITVRETRKRENSLDIVEGVKIPSG